MFENKTEFIQQFNIIFAHKVINLMTVNFVNKF